MREVKVRVHTSQNTPKHYVDFGFRRLSYDNSRDAKKAANEISKELTNILYECNHFLCECYQHNRYLWFLDCTIPGTRTNQFSSLNNVEHYLEMASGNNAHQVKNLLSALVELSKMYDRALLFYRSRNHSLLVKQCEISVDQIKRLEDRLNSIAPLPPKMEFDLLERIPKLNSATSI